MNAQNSILSAAVLLIICTLVSCSHLRPPEQATQASVLALEQYFAGRTRSWGIVEDRFGKVRSTFTADLVGTQRNGVFHLDQTFHFDDGRTERRQWQIRRVSAQSYEATATGIRGKAFGTIKGGAVHLAYTLETGLAGKTTAVRFDQWLWRQDKGVLFNRADVSKFGIKLARVSEVFQKQ